MSWDGIERRKEKEFCSTHVGLVSDLAVIKNSLQNIEKNIVEGATFRRGVIFSMISIASLLIVQIAAFAFLVGGMNKQIEVNTKFVQQYQARLSGK